MPSCSTIQFFNINPKCINFKQFESLRHQINKFEQPQTNHSRKPQCNAAERSDKTRLPLKEAYPAPRRALSLRYLVCNNIISQNYSYGITQTENQIPSE